MLLISVIAQTGGLGSVKNVLALILGTVKNCRRKNLFLLNRSDVGAGWCDRNSQNR